MRFPTRAWRAAARSHVGARITIGAASLLLASCKDSTEPLVPAQLAAVFTAPSDAPAGFPLQSNQLPSVKVTTANGRPVPNVTVTFSVTAGDGVITGAAPTTDGNGIARVGSWMLGPSVGLNTLTATQGTLTAVQFSVTSVPGSPVRLGVATAPSTTVANREQFPTQPVVQVQDAFGNAVALANAQVSAAMATLGASLSGTLTATTNAAGAATFTDLSIGGTAGFHALSFTAPSLTAITAPVTVTAGAPTAIAIHAGDNQTAAKATEVFTKPAVKVSDVDGNGVPDILVTFEVTSGGGSLGGATAVTTGSGIATVGSWTLGPAAGVNTLSASASIALAGNPLTFTATGVNFNVTSISPGLLAPGTVATITGEGFSTTPANNIVTIDGAAANVTAATETELTVVVPGNIPCAATHDGAVVVSLGAGGITKTHPVQPGTLRTLAPGQMLTIGDPAQTRCNELSSTGGLYYVSVSNISETFATPGAAFQLRGEYASGAAALNVTPLPATRTLAARAADRTDPGSREALLERERPGLDRTHLRVLEENIRFLEQNARTLSRATPGTTRQSLTRASAVGDQVTIRVPNISVSNFCTNYFEITGRVVYHGTRAIIVEDNANPMAGTIDTTYVALGQEFDALMFGVLETNYGNPLAMDDQLDNNDRIVMVFTRRINDDIENAAGFVVSCDFFPRNTTNNRSSNFGEHFYAWVPTVPGNISTATTGDDITPPRWSWLIRSTIIHEAKHITSFGERISRQASAFEESWLEESTARISEELYGRAIYSFAQRANLEYGSSSNPAGPYCDVRPSFTQCAGKPLTVSGIFQRLYREWYSAPQDFSPIGRTSSSDFSFYNTGWSLVRWTLDQSTMGEAAFLSALTQEPNLRGLTNLTTRAGRTFAQMLPEWTMALALDDHPGFSTTLANLRMPSWNMRSVFAGLNTDFPGTFGSAWPLSTTSNPFGSFTADATVLPGTSKFFTLSGAQAAKQLIELKASGSSADAPGELRLTIVRVQ